MRWVDSLGREPPLALQEDRSTGWGEADQGEGEVSAVVGGPRDQTAPQDPMAPRDPMAGDEEAAAYPNEGADDCIRKPPVKGDHLL